MLGPNVTLALILSQSLLSWLQGSFQHFARSSEQTAASAAALVQPLFDTGSRHSKRISDTFTSSQGQCSVHQSPERGTEPGPTSSIPAIEALTCAGRRHTKRHPRYGTSGPARHHASHVLSCKSLHIPSAVPRRPHLQQHREHHVPSPARCRVDEALLAAEINLVKAGARERVAVVLASLPALVSLPAVFSCANRPRKVQRASWRSALRSSGQLSGQSKPPAPPTYRLDARRRRLHPAAPNVLIGLINVLNCVRVYAWRPGFVASDSVCVSLCPVSRAHFRLPTWPDLRQRDP